MELKYVFVNSINENRKCVMSVNLGCVTGDYKHTFDWKVLQLCFSWVISKS